MVESPLVKTLLTTSAPEAAEFLRRGELVAFPTETVYGLGANAFDAAAVERIFVAKSRPADNPLIVHVASIGDVARLTREITPLANRLIGAFFPGPLTIVLPRSADVPDIVTGGLETVAVRMPRHPVALELLGAAGFPLCAPSANRSGRPSPTTWSAVIDDLGGRIACVLQGKATEIGLESTVVDARGDEAVILREGGLPAEEIAKVARVRFPAASEEAPASPGTRYRHYAPSAQVRRVVHPEEVRASRDAAFIGFHHPKGAADFARCRVVADAAEMARELFAFFRDCDASAVGTIYVELPAEEGIGRAIRDRLERAERR